ncbi:MAG: hypothetical protein JW760_01745 [Spirochaetales bacterium]|nr:hypothetical protein [Spirochaetales bacterium]
MKYLLRPVFFSVPALPAILLAFCLAASIFLGYNLDSLWYLGALTAAPMTLWLVAASRAKRRRTLLKRVKTLREEGRDTPLRPEDYHGYFLGSAPGAFPLSVDHRTCLDLNIGDLFTLLDRTVSIPGANMLYTLLRVPLFDTALLSKRRDIINALAEDAASAEGLQTAMGNLFHPGHDDVTPLLQHGSTEPPPSRGMSIVGTGTAILSVLALFLIHTSWVILLPLGSFVFSMVIYYRHYGTLTRQIGALGYIGALVKAAEILAGNKTLRRLDSDRAAALETVLPKIKIFRKQVNRITTFSPDAQDILSILIAYLKIFFLIDIHAYRRFLQLVETRRREILKAYELIGTLDAFLSTAAFLSTREKTALPQLMEGSLSIRSEEMYHPLITDPVANSFSIDPPGFIITGSNMAGKSTFLRTLALNALLAQTLGFCFAREYEAGLFFPVTSIEKRDSLTLGKSLYYDEAKRIFAILESTGNRTPVLCVIDELLSGTNSTERRKASVAILGYLARKGALVVSATHDLETVEKLSELYANVHFADRLDKGGLDFDYLLKPGILTGCNAIDLLERIGYPAEVVAQAREL